MGLIPYLVGLALLGVFFWFVRKSGKDAVIADVATKTVEVAEKVADAQGNSPSTHDELVDRLQRPGGKL